MLQQAHIQEILKGLSEAVLRWFPANLRGLPDGGLVRASDLAREEGIAMYGAPRQEIVSELLEAPDPESRRHILDVRAAEISLDCRALLQACSCESSRHMVAYTLEALDSFDAGYPTSAQALAASIIDTTLRAMYGARRSAFTGSSQMRV